uniref:RNase H type-1 domain-containing protein n=1 Tax=Cannabis sativa TaxID=3483 RepID=A0A803PCM1_CANSA
MWRACSNCLPTLVQLAMKKVAVNTSCPLCNVESESICHSLILCRELKQIWNRVGIGTSQAAGGSFLDCFLDQWRHAQKTPIESSWTGLQYHDGNEHWIKPQYNSIKINIDAALFEGQNRFGLSLVVRDHNGFLLQGQTKLHAGNMAAGIAEAMSFREALSCLKKQPAFPTWIETDCLSVVQALRSGVKMVSLFGDIIQECKSMLCELSHVKFSFVKRSANNVAHVFARAALLYPDCMFSMGSVPTDLLPYLVAEFEG